MDQILSFGEYIFKRDKLAIVAPLKTLNAIIVQY